MSAADSKSSINVPSSTEPTSAGHREDSHATASRLALSGLFEAARASLVLFLEEGRRVRIVLRRDVRGELPPRIVEGVPVGMGMGADGRERVTIRVAEGTDLLLLVERIASVAPWSE